MIRLLVRPEPTGTNELSNKTEIQKMSNLRNLFCMVALYAKMPHSLSDLNKSSRAKDRNSYLGHLSQLSSQTNVEVSTVQFRVQNSFHFSQESFSDVLIINFD